MCKCVNIEFGTHKNAVGLHTLHGKLVDIDKCIAREVIGLWSMGIETIESCCGHNKTCGYIAVAEADVKRMECMEFEKDTRTDVPGCFYPKSVERIFNER
jgi:hypothetical protein